MKQRGKNITDDLRPEYNLAGLLKGGVKGKYAKQYQAGTNLALIEPAIHSGFRTEKEVSDALRRVIGLRKTGGSRNAANREES